VNGKSQVLALTIDGELLSAERHVPKPTPYPTLNPTPYPTLDPTTKDLSSPAPTQITRTCKGGRFVSVNEVVEALEAGGGGGGGEAQVTTTEGGLHDLTLPSLLGNRYGCIFAFRLSLARGNHDLVLTSNDGSKLTLDGVEVIRNDGLHTARARRRTVYTQGGVSRLSVVYFQNGGSQVLGLSIDGEAVAAML